MRSSEQNAIRAAMASLRAAQPGGPVVDGDGAGIGVIGAEEQPGQLGAPGAEQPGQPEHLAGVHGEVDRRDGPRATQPGAILNN